MVPTDDWTSSAMRDGEVVAELLVTLKEAQVKPILITNPTVTALRWGFRQPRSRCSRKEAESVVNSRCSPSTPFSWSGGCGGSSSSSTSCYVDGYEATSRRISGSFVVGSRSKDIALRRSPFHEQDLENKNLKRMKMDEDSKEDGNFLVPDLNIMPCEEEIGDHYVQTTLYGLMIKR